MSLAEKFQITVPPKNEGHEPANNWATQDSARCTDGCMTSEATAKFNRMPKTQIHGKYEFANGFGGNTDVSDGLKPKAFVQGFNRLDMKATDDQYGGEHIDLFYGEAKDELGNVGFVERNNYLDRI
jgi:hypothetical protein